MRNLIIGLIILIISTPVFSVVPENDSLIIKGRNLTEFYMNTFSGDILSNYTVNGLWVMRDSSGLIQDETINANDGTLTGGLAFTDRIAQGLGYSILFNGTSDYIDCGDSDDFSFGNGSTDSAFSVGALVKIELGTGVRTIISKVDEYAIQLDATEKIVFILQDDSASGYISTTTDAALTEGYSYINCTYSGGGASSDLNVYVDGVLVASTDDSSTYTAMENLTNSFIIGRATTEFYDSYISSVSLIATELTANEVYNLYLATKAKYIY